MSRLRLFVLALALTLVAGCEELATGIEALEDLEELDGSATLVLINSTTTSVYFVYISECSSSDWGPDRLGASETIAVNASRSWTLDPGCWDVRAEFSDDGYAETSVTLGAGEEYTLRLTD